MLIKHEPHACLYLSEEEHADLDMHKLILLIDYTRGITAPRYPMPALFVDSVSDLAKRWSEWLDTDAMYGHRT